MSKYAYNGTENDASELVGDIVYVEDEYLFAFPSTGTYGASYNGYDTDTEIFLLSTMDFGSSWSQPRILSASPNGPGPGEDHPTIACTDAAPAHCIVRIYFTRCYHLVAVSSSIGDLS